MAVLAAADEAAERLDELIDRAMAGEKIVVVRAGMPIARLVPVPGYPAVPRLGTFAGRAKVNPEFFEEMTDGELARWGETSPE